MKEISLGRGFVAIIDDADYELVNQYRWHANHIQRSGACYAQRAVSRNGKRTTQSMHRFLLQSPPGFEVDHINGDGLDNRRSNLRVATPAENRRNLRHKRAERTSRLKGVSWHKASSRWRAQISVNGKSIHLGVFRTEEDAQRAYDKMAVALYGEYAAIGVAQEAR